MLYHDTQRSKGPAQMATPETARIHSPIEDRRSRPLFSEISHASGPGFQKVWAQAMVPPSVKWMTATGPSCARRLPPDPSSQYLPSPPRSCTGQ